MYMAVNEYEQISWVCAGAWWVIVQSIAFFVLL